MKPPSLNKILDVWRESWERTDRAVPFPIETDHALSDIGCTMFDLRFAVNLAYSVTEKKRSPSERKLCEMFQRTKMCQESALQRNLTQTPNGGIFLLKSQHQYRDASQLEVTQAVSLEDAIQHARNKP